jgi:hypothetical protein
MACRVGRRNLQLSRDTYPPGDPQLSLSRDEENQIRKAIEAIEEENVRNVLKGDEAAAAHLWADLWADDLILNAPNNQVLRKPQILERTKQHIALQYSS